ncbi:hypothetical protein LP7551_02280 [Roseibium album]|nr:hypothetical protein LP7551_02280 [Roseibium album]
MTRARNLQDEVSQLRSDANKDRPKRKRRAAKPASVEPDQDAEQEVSASVTPETEKLKDLSRQLNDLVNNAEDGIKDHPVAAVLGAFALGIVVGAALRR